MRCLTLAGCLRDHGATVRFVCRELPGNLCDQVSRRGFSVARLSYDDNLLEPTYASEYARWLVVSQECDAQQTGHAIDQLGVTPDWLVVDHYGLDWQWQQAMQSRVGRIMVIDDLANRRHQCEVLLDQNFHTKADDRYHDLVPPGCVRLMGPRYALLRPEFTALRGAMTEAEVPRLHVFMGGADPGGATMTVLQALANIDDLPWRADVVIGAINPWSDKIKAIAANNPQVTVHGHGVDMASLMSRSQLAIGAGGTSTWERCCLGLPSLIISVAANQTPIAQAVHGYGAGCFVGSHEELKVERLVVAIRRLLLDSDWRKETARRCRTLVDGGGTERVGRQMITLARERATA